jgi:hypothetical protein
MTLNQVPAPNYSPIAEDKILYNPDMFHVLFIHTHTVPSKLSNNFWLGSRLLGLVPSNPKDDNTHLYRGKQRWEGDALCGA